MALAFGALSGRLLVSQDEDVRVAVESGIMSRYHDRRHYMERHLAWADRDILEKGWA